MLRIPILLARTHSTYLHQCTQIILIIYMNLEIHPSGIASLDPSFQTVRSNTNKFVCFRSIHIFPG